jgi:hypothetical protein
LSIASLTQILAAQTVCYYESPLTPTTQFRIKRFFVRQSVLVCVIASLCFSVGEGLRLRPFPVSNSTTNAQLTVNASAQNALTRYGPIDLPTRAQSRGKRQMVEFGNPPAQEWRELTAQQVLLRDSDEGVSSFSCLLRFTFTGRSPPFVS